MTVLQQENTYPTLTKSLFVASILSLSVMAWFSYNEKLSNVVTVHFNSCSQEFRVLVEYFAFLSHKNSKNLARVHFPWQPHGESLTVSLDELVINDVAWRFDLKLNSVQNSSIRVGWKT